MYVRSAKIHLRVPFRSLVTLGVLAFYVGCGSEAANQPRTASSEARDVLDSLRYDLLHSAASDLREFDFVRASEAVRLDSNGDTMAVERVQIRFSDGTGRIVRDTIVGSFPTGSVSRIVGPETNHVPDSTTFQWLLPQDPPYLSGRTRGAYRVELVQEGDWHAVEITLADTADVELDVRRAILAYEPDLQQVTGVEIERRMENYLAQSRSLARLDLVQVDDTTWLPRHFYYRQTRNAPLQKPYDLIKIERYADFQRR